MRLFSQSDPHVFVLSGGRQEQGVTSPSADLFSLGQSRQVSVACSPNFPHFSHLLAHLCTSVLNPGRRSIALEASEQGEVPCGQLALKPASESQGIRHGLITWPSWTAQLAAEPHMN